jgi:hypothetical protein
LRKTSQEFHKAALTYGKDEIERVLVSRWQAPHSRKEWILRLVHSALDMLPCAPFHIEHASDLTLPELDELRAEIERRNGSVAGTIPVADARAGLRISARSACLDGTLRGLLARPAEVDGKLLSEIDAQLGGGR